MLVFMLYMVSPIILASLVKIASGGASLEKANIRKVYLVICFLAIALMIGLRHFSNGSGDTRFYCVNWIELRETTFSDFKVKLFEIDLEKGYLIAVWIFAHIFKDYQFVMILSGTFFAISVCCFVSKNSKNPIMSLLIFNCIGIFSFLVQGLRQGIAMCICLFAIEKCKKKQLFKFILLILLAMTFHSSAILFSVVYILQNFKINVPSFMVFTLVVIIVVSLLPKIFQFMNTLLNDDYSTETATSEDSVIITVLIYAAILLVSLLFYEKSKDDNHYSIFFYMCCISTIMMMLRGSTSTIVERVGFYFSFSSMILVPNCIDNIEDKPTKIFTNIAVGILFIVLAYHKASYSELVPYEFYWR